MNKNVLSRRAFLAGLHVLNEEMMFDDMFARGNTPWALWDESPRNARYRLQSNGNGKKT